MRGLLNGTGAIASLVGAGFLWRQSAGDPSRQTALLIFALSLVALYTVSGLYHCVPWRQLWKQRMQRLDHSMIYLVIAGTYTPIGFVVLDGGLRWGSLGAIWVIVLVGIAQKVLLPKVGSWLSITLQMLQGWLGLFLWVPIAERLPEAAMGLLLLGGLLYTFGLVLFIIKRPRRRRWHVAYHEVFHLFVVAGSAVHYAAIFAYVTPYTAL